MTCRYSTVDRGMDRGTRTHICFHAMANDVMSSMKQFEHTLCRWRRTHWSVLGRMTEQRVQRISGASFARWKRPLWSDLHTSLQILLYIRILRSKHSSIHEPKLANLHEPRTAVSKQTNKPAKQVLNNGRSSRRRKQQPARRS